MTLSQDEINTLASLGISLQYKVNDYNTTGVDLAARLLQSLNDEELYRGHNVTEIVGLNLGTTSRDVIAETLGKYPLLPMDRMSNGVAAGWIIMFLISGIVVAMRFFSKVYFKLGLRRDDWVLLLAWLTGTANNIEDVYVYLAHNWGAHCWNQSLTDIVAHYRIAAVDGFLMFISSFLFKSALLFFYYDLYPAKGFRIAIYTMGFVITIYMVFAITWSAVRCTPFDTWNHPDDYKCMPSELALIYAITAINVPIDLVIVGMPIVAVRVLSLRMSERLALLALISVAALVCVASIVRLTTLRDYIISSDVSWRAIPATTWALIEVHLGVVCVSVPALRKLVQLIIRKCRFGGRVNHIPTPSTDSSAGGSVVEVWRQEGTGSESQLRSTRTTSTSKGSDIMVATCTTTTTMSALDSIADVELDGHPMGNLRPARTKSKVGSMV